MIRPLEVEQPEEWETKGKTKIAEMLTYLIWGETNGWIDDKFMKN